MKVLVLDNYDSFTYNIVHSLNEIGDIDISVIRNDKIKLDDVVDFDKIILSPGPSLPKDAGLMNLLISKFYKKIPILGICLGHQALAENFGCKLYNMKEPYHGVQTEIFLDKDYIFKGINNNIKACRYHSWSVLNSNLPKDLNVIAKDKFGTIMAISHKKYSIRGIQFHPESIQTPDGNRIIRNFIKH